jgi:hypothetical protein
MTEQDKFEQWYAAVYCAERGMGHVKPEYLSKKRVGPAYRPDYPQINHMWAGWKGKARHTGLDPEMGFLLEGANEGEWAAYEYGCRSCEAAVANIVDGKDTGKGLTNEPWNTLRQRLLEMKNKAGRWDNRDCSDC